jgi:glycosyltransferase involved in cell wall biosynthesis
VAILISTLRLRRVFSRNGVGFVFGNDFNELSALLAAATLRIPRVTRLRFVFHAPTWVRRGYLTLLALAANKVLCVSEFVLAANSGDLPFLKGRFATLYDWYEDSPDQETGQSLHPSVFKVFGIPASARVVLMPGRMEPLKGQHVLVEAARKISETIPDAVILFVGPAVRGRGRESYQEGLCRRSEALGLSGNVFFSDHVDNVPDLMRAASVVVQCSTGPEGFGLSVLEGLWYGTPVVASGVGGPLEIVGNPPAALLHTPGNASELGEAVVRILTDRHLAAQLVRLGKERAERFTRERLWPEFESVIEDLLSERTPRSER